SVGQGTAIPDLPEVKRVRETQKNISSIQYKAGVEHGTSVSETPEMERVKRNQLNISTVTLLFLALHPSNFHRAAQNLMFFTQSD
uniref:Uncharacterized protein n=1 Tax=Cyclopterus lumpus TaxID=8103 RepID=A0A8C3ARE2_CYCLU